MALAALKPSDGELADAVRGAIKILNDALRAAHDAGLLVKIDYTPHQTVNQQHCLSIYRAEVWRRA